jgi:hypothetical protein
MLIFLAKIVISYHHYYSASPSQQQSTAFILVDNDQFDEAFLCSHDYALSLICPCESISGIPSHSYMQIPVSG